MLLSPNNNLDARVCSSVYCSEFSKQHTILLFANSLSCVNKRKHHLDLMAELLPIDTPTIEIEKSPREVVRVEKNLTSMGFFTPSHKRLENITEKRVSIMVREDGGRRIEASATIVPAAKFGLPITADQDKYYAFQKLLENRRDREGKISNPVAFSTHEMLKTLGMSRAGKNYDDIREWLSRMTFTGIESEGVIYL